MAAPSTTDPMQRLKELVRSLTIGQPACRLGQAVNTPFTRAQEQPQVHALVESKAAAEHCTGFLSHHGARVASF